MEEGRPGQADLNRAREELAAEQRAGRATAANLTAALLRCEATETALAEERRLREKSRPQRVEAASARPQVRRSGAVEDGQWRPSPPVLRRPPPSWVSS